MYGLGSLAGLVRDGSSPTMGSVLERVKESLGSPPFSLKPVFLSLPPSQPPLVCPCCPLLSPTPSSWPYPGDQVKDGIVPGATQTYLAACAGTAIGALTGSSPLIIAAESAVGIKEGGRTGLTAVTVAACFLISLPLSPLLQVTSAQGGGGPLASTHATLHVFFPSSGEGGKSRDEG